MTLDEFSDKHNVGLQLFIIPFRKDLDDIEDEWSKSAKHYAFILSNDNKTYKGHYSQGSGIKNRPKIEDILNSLLMDTMDVNESFTEWCDSYGYDRDSIRAHKIYSLCQEEYEGLKLLFTSRQLEELYECDTL